ncbi:MULTISPECIES: FMN-dependent NADH-azoreductase [Novosphingobium]|uniref:FMN dependent NADH:quinone oxidoreductase n=1 Tax=Novosphingobium decolorationis TaxID=2698673 RepID=A0ABX8E8I6_9SPHN|nr:MULTISPECIES: NAD(P)H-dependent oxidoreductase [Novosphingobium]MED5544413.1 NAD(P)H-dependent oxidoreductase [Pseudomonadota bacterium]QVM85374.1 NAD(P)H-dependent oxidoreductase [Novosphingobium decolorationis]GAM03376.1 acyl carrier protein phosphodiesterase [Novosphingobium sp. MBES04]
MTKYLVVRSAATGAASVSNQLIDTYLAELGEDAVVVERNLDTDPVPHINSGSLVGIGRAAPVGDKMTDASLEARELQDALIAEVMDADVLVIGLPIYNFGLPSTLKAWFDYVLRAGTTFQYTEQGPEGLVKNTKAIVAQSRAGKYDDDAGVIFGMPHLKGLLGFMGVTDVEVVTAEGMAFGPEAAASAIADAKAAIAKLA